MINRKKNGIAYGVALLAVIAMFAFIGCSGSETLDGTVSTTDLANYQKSFMSSYYAERGGIALGAKALTPFWRDEAKAAINVAYLTTTSFTALVASTSNSIANYPEINQTTSFTVTKSDAAYNVYDVVAITMYPAADDRAKYLEEYYVRDIGKNSSGYFDTAEHDGIWTVDDPIVEYVGGAWVQNQSARVRQTLYFDDGTVRSETIVRQSDSISNPVHFAAFDVSGSLDFSQTFYPATDANALFSSIVIYKVTPARSYSFWFWSGSSSQTILGVRYYTEFKDAAKYYGYTICFEKTLSEYITATESFPSTMTTVFVGSKHDTLAESVLRQKTVWDLDASGNAKLSTAVKTTNMKSRVVDVTGRKDFYVTQLDTDYSTLSGWDTTTIYVPTGSAEETLAADASKLTYLETRGTIENAGGTTIPIATENPGTGDVATLYASLTNGVYEASTTTATPTGGLQGTNSAWTFDGATKGTQITSSSSYELSTTGSVETWIYMNSIVDTAGIVHKGVAADFSDECYSLQLWGSSGTLAIVLDAPGTGNSYDLVTSKKNLNKAAWYHIVATWDTVSAKNICLYVNGSLSNSATPSTIAAAGVRNNTSDIVIGSQLPSKYSTLYGYFSFDGKIVGTKIYGTALTAAEVKANYDAYKSLTTGW
jgi:hypothetical protein